MAKSDLEKILKQALKEDVQLKKMALKIIETEALIELSGGDARKLL